MKAKFSIVEQFSFNGILMAEDFEICANIELKENCI